MTEECITETTPAATKEEVINLRKPVDAAAQSDLRLLEGRVMRAEQDAMDLQGALLDDRILCRHRIDDLSSTVNRLTSALIGHLAWTLFTVLWYLISVWS